jgi:thymidine kinase
MSFLGVIIGCMFAEKTSELLRQVRLETILGKSVTVVVPDIDTRITDVVYTHHGDNGGVSPVKVDHLQLTSFALDTDVVAIDEGQFFADLVPAVTNLLSQGKTVWVAGLSGDFQQRPLGHILDLIPLADNVVYLRALCLLCKNGTRASFSKRLDAHNKNPVDIGDCNKYVAVCRKHL